MHFSYLASCITQVFSFPSLFQHHLIVSKLKAAILNFWVWSKANIWYCWLGKVFGRETFWSECVPGQPDMSAQCGDLTCQSLWMIFLTNMCRPERICCKIHLSLFQNYFDDLGPEAGNCAHLAFGEAVLPSFAEPPDCQSMLQQASVLGVDENKFFALWPSPGW